LNWRPFMVRVGLIENNLAISILPVLSAVHRLAFRFS